eukprot:5846360-Pleurochrysis_carterae.AAC.2
MQRSGLGASVNLLHGAQRTLLAALDGRRVEGSSARRSTALVTLTQRPSLSAQGAERVYFYLTAASGALNS